MITIKHIQNRTCPVIMCDKCHEPIKEAEDAMVVFDTEYGPDEESKPEFFHKRTCDPGKRVRTWMELTEFLADLVYNAGLGTKKISAAMAKSKRHGEMGL